MLKEKKKSQDPDSAPAVDPNWPRDLETRLNRLSKATMDVKVVLGRVSLPLETLAEMDVGSLIETETLSGMPMEILVNGTLFGKGEMVVIGDNMAVRVTDLLRPEDMVNG